MTPPPDDAEPLRTLAFAAPEGALWGAGWFPGSGPGVLIVSAGGGARALEASLDAAGEEWRVSTPQGELRIAPEGEAAQLGAGERSPSGSEQLCRVSGGLELGEAPGAVEAPGRRGERQVPDGLERQDSVREVSAWFGDGEAAVLVAARPRKHKGHEQDACAAVVLDPEAWPAITDPRLSTTYAADGRVRRMTLELWNEDPEQLPRRVAGEALGQGASGRAGDWALSAELLLCHSRGRDGLGVYLLARPA